MLTISFDLSQLVGFLLLLCRVGGVMAVAPMLGSERLPSRLKAAVAVMVSLVLAPVAGHRAAPEGAVAVGLAAAGELIVGLAIGFGARLIFAAVNMAGELADLQSGFGFAGMVSPQSGERTSVIGQLHLCIAWLIFLQADAHHTVLAGLGASLAVIPVGADPGACAPALSAAAAGMISAAVRIAAPVVGAVLLADLALGLLTRAAPQMNLLAIGFPVKLAVGLCATLLALPLLASAQRGLLFMTEAILRAVLVALR